MDKEDKETSKEGALRLYLAKFISSHKLQRMEEVLAHRTRRITVAIEDVHKSHNASAVIRNCDVAGVQDLHIIDNHNKYKVNTYVTRGSAQWVDILRYNLPNKDNTLNCYEALRSKGYKIYATVPGTSGIKPEELDVHEKIALVLGNEYTGLSEIAIKNADECINLPMYGFTDSYNISVTAAICLYTFRQSLGQSDIDWQLTEGEKEQLRLIWYKQIVKRSDVHTKLFLNK